MKLMYSICWIGYWTCRISTGMALIYPFDITIDSFQQKTAVPVPGSYGTGSTTASWVFTFAALTLENVYLMAGTNVNVSITATMVPVSPDINGTLSLPPSYFCIYSSSQYSTLTSSIALQYPDRYALPCTVRRTMSPNGSFVANFVLKRMDSFVPYAMARLPRDYRWHLVGSIAFRNPDGSYLARNDIQNVGMFTALLTAYCVLLAYAFLENYRENFKNLVQWLMVASVSCYMISAALFLRYYTDANYTGTLNSSFKIGAGVIETLADSILFLMLAVCSLGWTIIDRSIPQREKLIFIFIAALYLVLGGIEQLPDSFTSGFASLVKIFLRITIAFVLNITINASVLRYRGRTLAQEREKVDRTYALELVTSYCRLELLHYLRRSIAPFLLAQTIFLFLQVFYLSETQLWMGNLLNHIVILVYLFDLTRRFGKEIVDVTGLSSGKKNAAVPTREYHIVHKFIEPLYLSNEGTGFGVALFVIANYLEHMSMFRGAATTTTNRPNAGATNTNDAENEPNTAINAENRR